MTLLEYQVFYKTFVKPIYDKDKLYFDLGGIEEEIYKKFIVIEIPENDDKKSLINDKIQKMREDFKERREKVLKYGNIINVLLFIKSTDYPFTRMCQLLDVSLHHELLVDSIKKINRNYKDSILQKGHDFSIIKESFEELGGILDLFYSDSEKIINFIGELITLTNINDNARINYTLIVTILEFLFVNDSRKNDSIKYQLKSKSIAVLNTLKYLDTRGIIDIERAGKEFGLFYDIRSNLVHGNEGEIQKILDKYGKEFLPGSEKERYLDNSYRALRTYTGSILKIFLYDINLIKTLKNN